MMDCEGCICKGCQKTMYQGYDDCLICEICDDGSESRDECERFKGVELC
jgi:hypothetical protein